MPDKDLPIRIAQTLGVTTSAVLAGSTANVSFALVPRLLESPTPLLLRQWRAVFLDGQRNAPPIAVLSSACYFYLAYALPSHSSRDKLYGYLAAGALAIGIIPYTILTMRPTNEKLLAKAEETRGLGFKDEIVEAGLGEETAHKLLDNWGLLNLGRAGMLVLGSVVGLWTVVS